MPYRPYPPRWMDEPLFAAAAPPCHEPDCIQPLVVVQVSWRNDNAVWLVDKAYIVCLAGHRHDITP